MKRLLAIIAICILLAPGISWGAIAATTVWEIQTGGANTNGCGYNPSNATPGTDYSQQAAAQDSGTDLASADGDASPCVVTSATHDFVDADEGNLIHITETGDGFTVGWYEIVSTSGNAATLDRACGTDGAKTGGDWAYGGACKIADTLDGDMFAAVTAGNTIYIKSGAYTAGEAITGTAGSDALQVEFYGYKTTRANALDGTTTGTDRPSIDMGGNGFVVTTGFWDIRNIIMTNPPAAGVLLTVNQSSSVINCKITTSNIGTALSLAGYSKVINSEISAGTTYNCLPLQGGLAVVLSNYIHDCAICVNAADYLDNIIAGNIIDTCSTAGIRVLAIDTEYIIGNTLYGADHATADGIIITTGDRLVIMNNIIANWNTGISITTGTQLYEDYNAFYSNDSDGVTLGPHSITGTDPQFPDAANGDFRVGPGMRSKAFPNGVILPGTSANGKGYTDMGALQTAGGGAWAK